MALAALPRRAAALGKKSGGAEKKGRGLFFHACVLVRVEQIESEPVINEWQRG
jgi:hypothetical protein